MGAKPPASPPPAPQAPQPAFGAVPRNTFGDPSGLLGGTFMTGARSSTSSSGSSFMRTGGPNNSGMAGVTGAQNAFNKALYG